MHSCEVLPLNYRLKKDADFSGFSKENWIGLLVTALFLAATVLLALPTHPFTLLNSASDTVMSLVYCIALFALRRMKAPIPTGIALIHPLAGAVALVLLIQALFS